ncbi:WecB/TagA/CpsF family glycosyltransferase [Thalassotalea nanhaiensis]|uniref:WecB/TagA/CpsF family glycosyltransferase n=1 Tax=Thalassotalea nanhaiensis TaxID=3065648 RepID=A0ABY9TN48_9GAMM|nr:WecB/TagA/CpsF family glycosyltransferase [Colwelliaceae bacterium SQ345]
MTSSTNCSDNNICRLFDLPINNVPMSKAINWVISHRFNLSSNKSHTKASEKPNLGFFINAHSINLSFKYNDFYQTLKQADCLFADGIGMRLAANHIDEPIQENVNGSDMLPKLCEQAANEGKSIFFLGASPGVASKAAKRLHKTYPKLKVAGYQHGYFKKHDNKRIIAKINQSKADILLVALGSPLQEIWLTNNAEYLHCNTALAVGGLFDFYSGNIPRAPLWLRNLNLEWLFRLLQEPKNKFYRYVIGNPIFLFRTYLFRQAAKAISNPPSHVSKP